MEKLNEVLNSINPEFVEFTQQACQHSGKPCGVISGWEISNCIEIHGIETAKRLLALKQKSVAADWIELNANALDKLAIQQPKEYFIYALATILQPPIDEAKIDNSLADFNLRKTAWQNLQAFDSGIIRPITEIVRRLINKAPPRTILNKLNKITHINIAKVTESLLELTRLQTACEKLLKGYIEKPFQFDDENSVSFSAFSKQKRIMALSQLEESIFNEFNDFEIIPGKKAESIPAITGLRYGRMKKKKNKLFINEKTGFQLKITGSK